jgi:small subunit ribosomal protein S17
MDKKNKLRKENSVEKKKGSGRLLKGEVVSDKMDKTIVVLVSRLRRHPRYQRRYKIDKRYKVDDEKNEYKIGDQVVIREGRPMSKSKKWRVVKKI